MRFAHSPRLLESRFCSAGIIKKNPLHEFSLEAAKMARVEFMLNVTLDRKKQITGVFAGDLEGAHDKGVEFCRKHAQVEIEKPAEIVITTNAGYPLDQDFYQTVKGMVSALPAVRPGGTIIIASECSKGMGSENFRRMLFEMQDMDSFIEKISKPENFRVDQWEVEELVKALRVAKIKVFSEGVEAEDLRKSHVEPLKSVEQGIEESLKEYGDDATIIAVPSGPYVIPWSKEKI
jgi:lactate racemase